MAKGKTEFKIALRIAVFYAIIGSVWILFSDGLVATVATTPQRILQMQTYKGWFFIATTSVILYLLVYRYITMLRNSEEELYTQKEWFRVTLSSIGDAVIATDNLGRIVFINQAAMDLTGYSAEEAMGQSIEKVFYIISEDTRLPSEIPIDKVLREGIIVGLANHTALIAKDGSEYSIADSAAPIRNDDQEIIGVVLVFQDISEGKRSTNILRRLSEGISGSTGLAFFESLVQELTETLGVHMAIIARTTDEIKDKAETLAISQDGKIVDNFIYNLVGTPCANVACGKICCYPSDVQQLFPDDKILQELNLQSYIGTPLRDSAGTVMGVLVVLDNKPMLNAELFQSMFKIVAVRAAAEMERLRYEEQVKYMAFHDSLTELPNRRMFDQRLKQAIEICTLHQSKVAVMFMDLDRMKLINDTLGHTVGDQLLQIIAKRIQHFVDHGATLCRLGGDEFALIIPDIASVEEIKDLAQRIIEQIKQPVLINNQEMYITSSIGIAFYPEDGFDSESLLIHADTAMYRAKQLGRNNFQFYKTSMDVDSSHKLVLLNHLNKALEREEFLLYYQPKVDVIKGESVGLEALIRWQHPEYGLISPGQFIPIAEETGMIVPLGEWVLRTACTQNKLWQEAGMAPVRISVNISAVQFRQEEFIDKVRQTLEETGVEPTCLEIEITESIAMQDVDFTIQMLSKLQSMGITIAIDDFGTGYSSLSYLKKFPLDTLKIDQSFVREVTKNQNDAAIASAIIAIAHSLNLDVIAEGVETEAEMHFLREKGCLKMQGYYYGKPAPAEECLRWLVKNI